MGSGTLDVSSATGFTNEGTVRPGTSPGILTIVGNYTETAGMGAVVIEIGGTEAGSQYDRLVVTGTATLANSLSVVLINAFEPNKTTKTPV